MEKVAGVSPPQRTTTEIMASVGRSAEAVFVLTTDKYSPQMLFNAASAIRVPTLLLVDHHWVSEDARANDARQIFPNGLDAQIGIIPTDSSAAAPSSSLGHPPRSG